MSASLQKIGYYGSIFLYCVSLIAPSYSTQKWLILTDSYTLLTVLPVAYEQSGSLGFLVAVCLFFVVPIVGFRLTKNLLSIRLTAIDKRCHHPPAYNLRWYVWLASSVGTLFFGAIFLKNVSISIGVVVYITAITLLVLTYSSISSCVNITSTTGPETAARPNRSVSKRIKHTGYIFIMLTTLAMGVVLFVRFEDVEPEDRPADRNSYTKSDCYREAERMMEYAEKHNRGFSEGDLVDQAILKRRACDRM